jgi:hypothetical protein
MKETVYVKRANIYKYIFYAYLAEGEGKEKA